MNLHELLGDALAIFSGILSGALVGAFIVVLFGLLASRSAP